MNMIRVLVLALIGSPLICKAALDQDLDRMFDGMSNTTHPTAQMGQRRGVLSGGSLALRHRVMQAKPITMTPPGISGGCSGIDLYGGSFSFINQSEFTGLLRSIAANAGGYAFQLGINAMCPDCGSLMSDLQKKVQSLNEHLANSCQLAQGIVHDGISAINANQQNRISQLSLAEGLGDAFQSFTAAQGDPLQRTTATQAALLRKHISGNLIWRALHQQTNALLAPGNGDDWLEAMMSVTGTLMVQSPLDQPVTNEKSLPVVRLPPLLGIRELLQGGDSERTWGFKTQMYRCDDHSVDGCLHPSLVPFEMEGLISRVNKLLGGSEGATGILLKFATGQGSFSTEELQFMEQAPQSLTALVRNLAREDPGLARHFVQEAGPILAIDMAGDLLEEMIQATRESGRIDEHPFHRVIDDALNETLANVREERKVLENRWGNISSLVGHYQALMHTGRGHDYGIGEPLASGSRRGPS